MIHNLPLLSSSLDVNDDASLTTSYQLSTSKNDPHIPTSRFGEQKQSPPYSTIPVGGNRCFVNAAAFQDPLFYQQPLHLDHNRSISSTTKYGHERGDRDRLADDLTSSEQRREKTKSTQRKYSISRQKKEQRRKPSTKRLNQRDHKDKNRTTTRQLRYQSKTRPELLRKRRRQRKALSKKNKNQRAQSKQRSTSKVNKNKSSISAHPHRSKNVNNHRTTNGDKRITQNIHTWKKHESHSLSSLNSKPLSRTKLGQTFSKNNLRHANSKQLKGQSRCSTKLNIRSPTHTTFKRSIRCQRKGTSRRLGITFPRCTSKTIITIASPINKNDQTSVQSIGTNNGEYHARSSASSISSKKDLMNKNSSNSKVMPLTKNTARITSKNNNRRALKTKRQRNSSISPNLGSRVILPMIKGMTLRSRTIMINKHPFDKMKRQK